VLYFLHLKCNSRNPIFFKAKQLSLTTLLFFEEILQSSLSLYPRKQFIIFAIALDWLNQHGFIYCWQMAQSLVAISN